MGVSVMGDGVRSSHPSCRARPLTTTIKSNQILPSGQFFPLHTSLQTEQHQTNPLHRDLGPQLPPSISISTTATTEIFPQSVHERNDRRRNFWRYRLFAPSRVAHGAPEPLLRQRQPYRPTIDPRCRRFKAKSSGPRPT